MATAKYIANKNNLTLFISSALGERKMGFISWDEMPKDFETQQFLNENYKFGSGESKKEVRERLTKIITDIINNHRGKNIAIVSHATAFVYYLENWCKVELTSDGIKMKFKDQVFFNKNFNAPELFKLVFNDNNELISIENIEVEGLSK